MANVLCLLVVLMRVFLTASVGLYQDFIMITDFSNKVLKNNPTDVFQISTRSLLECSAQCGRHCNCFGFNELTKVCRVFKTCDWAAEMESEDGWTYHSIKESGEMHFTIHWESTSHVMNCFYLLIFFLYFLRMLILCLHHSENICLEYQVIYSINRCIFCELFLALCYICHTGMSTKLLSYSI